MPFNVDLVDKSEDIANTCFEVKSFEISGHPCKNTMAAFWNGGGHGFHIDTPSIKNCEGHAEFNSDCGYSPTVGSEDVFGYYASRNPKHTCSATGTSTTSYFVGELVSSTLNYKETCTEIWEEAKAQSNEAQLIDTSAKYELFIDGGIRNARCVFTLIGDNQIFIGTMFEYFSLHNAAHTRCGWHDDSKCTSWEPDDLDAVELMDPATANSWYRWNAGTIQRYRQIFTAPYLLVTCNSVTDVLNGDYLAMPFNAALVDRPDDISGDCFQVDSWRISGHRCKNTMGRFWMNDDHGFHIDSTLQGDKCVGPGFNPDCGYVYPNKAYPIGSEDVFGFYGAVANPSGHDCSKDASSTTSYFVGELVDYEMCVNPPATFDWNDLIDDGWTGIGMPDAGVGFTISQTDLVLNVHIELPYLGYTSVDTVKERYGTSYLLDFEDIETSHRKLEEPGICENREKDSFYLQSVATTARQWDEWWKYSTSPQVSGHIGSRDYVSYGPPNDQYWTVSMKAGDECNTIVYDGSFTWNDLKGCRGFNDDPNDAQLSYIETVDGTDTLTLSGVFYANVFSPYYDSKNLGDYYRIYQVLSQPFVLSVSKNVYVLGSMGVDLITMSIISVYKENKENVYKMVVLTEASDYLKLTHDDNIFEFTSSATNTNTNLENEFNAQATRPTMTVASSDYYDSGDTNAVRGCLNNKAFICSQLWNIEATDVNCDDGKNEYINFSGTYTIGFGAECREVGTESIDQVHRDHCDTWLSEHSQIATGVTKSADLTWQDTICAPETMTYQFTASMTFHDEGTPGDANTVDWDTEVATAKLFVKGTETVYVELKTTFPVGQYDIFDSELKNVWLCTFDPKDEPDPITPDAMVGGCFSQDIDDQAKYFYHVFDADRPVADNTNGFVSSDHPTNSAEDKQRLRFYFVVPADIARDELYVHCQIEVTLTSPTTTRRMLIMAAHTGSMNQMNHFIGQTGVSDEPQNKPPPQQPQGYDNNNNNYNNHQQEPQQWYQPNQVNQPQTYSTLIFGIGFVLAVVLAINICVMCYMNCYRQQSGARGAVFGSRRRGARYERVKPQDSESYDDSEVNPINVVQQ